jgi:hypothetical protein
MLKTPYKKDNKFISLSKNAIKLSITDVKIKGIKKLLNGKGYSLTLFISDKTNNDTINDLIKIDNNIAEEILKESNKWFGKSFEKNDVDELYTKSFCNQTKTINVIITNKEFNNIIYNNLNINDIDTIINMLKENNNYKKCIINLTIEYIGLYFYSEYTSNKWLIKSMDITDMQKDTNEWFCIDDIIDKIGDRVKILEKNTNIKISKYNALIEEYQEDYKNIKDKFKDVKEYGNTKEANNLLNNINELLIIQEEKINRLL